MKAESQLRLADQRKDEFLAMLAHELRNPLAPISAGAQLLQSGHATAAAVERTASIIVRQVHHMTRLVDDLLDVSRVTRGLVTVTRVPLNVADMVADAVEQAEPLFKSKHQQFELSLPEVPQQVNGDHKRLVRLVVSDSGIGMAPELRARVFELFAQADRNPDRSQGGLGLGLALVKSLVELHGGSVCADSPGEQQGSTFTISLPGGPGQHAAAASGPSTAAGAKLRVLVVDDNIDAAQTLQLLLDASGHEVLVAHTALEALEIAQRMSPELCLLDIGLPDLSGNELERGLRALPQTADATLVAVTGYGSREDRDLASEAGFDHYFVKPVDVEAL